MDKSFKVKDKKEGITCMVSAELFTNRVLKPFLIFDGVFGGENMKKHSGNDNSTVLFNEGHWMSTSIYRIYLESLLSNYKGKILLVVDTFSSHDSVETLEFLDFVKKEFESGARESMIVQLLIPPGCTSILQVADVGINNQLKKVLKDAFVLCEVKFKQEKRKGVTMKDFQENNVLSYHRDEFIKMVELAFEFLNNQEGTWLLKLFQKCGQDIRDKETCKEKFKQHLKEVQESTSPLSTVIDWQF